MQYETFSLNFYRLSTPKVVELSGKFVILILPASSSSAVDLMWESIHQTAAGETTTVGYADSYDGVSEWRPNEPVEGLAWAVTASDRKFISWQMTAPAGSCEKDTLCACIYLGIYKVTAQGSLEEVEK